LEISNPPKSNFDHDAQPEEREDNDERFDYRITGLLKEHTAHPLSAVLGVTFAYL
jgi:hypothetical protein